MQKTPEAQIGPASWRLSREYSNFLLKLPDFMQKSPEAHNPGARIWLTSFTLDADVSPLFPYINGLIEDAVWYERPFHIRFTFKRCRCILYPESVSAWFFEDLRPSP